ncbi:MAG: hypothetical protein Q8M09_11795 [Pseudomonadota bacterium]|nr:hypothetical protein [Pseudomonadota bacterium]MDP1904912.1 hypothetical protein [Pseudomonadota bacterium]MDP2352035.1 hypothetical protein [Pseudomonadota bacterium]
MLESADIQAMLDSLKRPPTDEAIEEFGESVARRIVAYRDSVPSGRFNIKAVERRDLPNVVLVCYQIGTRHFLWLSIYRQRTHGTAGAVTKARMSMRAKACLGMFETPDQAAEIIIREACQVLQLPEPTPAPMEIIDDNGVPLLADPFQPMPESTP